jgi:hypothetical protein
MLALLAAAAFLGAGASAETLTDRVDREYVRPALEQVRGAFEGRAPAWTPPALPGSAAARGLSDKVRARWLDPLLTNDQGLALDAARSLASPRDFAGPGGRDPSSFLPGATLSPAAQGLVDQVEARFLSRVFSPEYALEAARALGSGRQAAGPADPPPPTGDPAAEAAAAVRRASAAAASARRVNDSTRLVRGSGASGDSGSGPHLKPVHSRFTALP